MWGVKTDQATLCVRGHSIGHIVSHIPAGVGLGPSATSSLIIPVQNKLPPGPPRTLQVAVSNGALQLSWQPPTFNGGLSASEYRVVIVVDSDNSLVTDQQWNSTQFTQGNLVNGVSLARAATAGYLIEPQHPTLAPLSLYFAVAMPVPLPMHGGSAKPVRTGKLDRARDCHAVLSATTSAYISPRCRREPNRKRRQRHVDPAAAGQLPYGDGTGDVGRVVSRDPDRSLLLLLCCVLWRDRLCAGQWCAETAH